MQTKITAIILQPNITNLIKRQYDGTDAEVVQDTI